MVRINFLMSIFPEERKIILRFSRGAPRPGYNYCHNSLYRRQGNFIVAQTDKNTIFI